MRYLNLEKVKDYTCIELENYPQIKHLCLNITKFNELPLPTNNKKILTELKQLTLTFTRTRGTVNVDLNRFSSQTSIDFENITYLSLMSREYPAGSRLFPGDIFQSLLLLMPNVEYFDLDGCHLTFRTDVFNAMDIKQLFPKLKGFSNDTFYNKLLNKVIVELGSSLRSLSFADNSGIEIPSNVSLANVEEAVIDPVGRNHIFHILDKTTKLKRLQLVANHRINWQRLMKELFTKQKSLESLTIIDNNSQCAEAICNAIENGICISNFSEKGKDATIKIQLWFRKGWDSNAVRYGSLMPVSRIVNHLRLSKWCNFMLLFGCEGNPNETEQDINLWTKANKDTLSITISNDSNKIYWVVTSKGCRIPGYGVSLNQDFVGV